MVRLGLADGAVFEGRCEGPWEPREGEAVFTTGSTGYPQGLTDPSYRGQILVFAFPLVGQYGVDEDAWRACDLSRRRWWSPGFRKPGRDDAFGSGCAAPGFP